MSSAPPPTPNSTWFFSPFHIPPPTRFRCVGWLPSPVYSFQGETLAKKILGGVEPTPFVCDRAGSMGLGLASRLCVGRSSSALSYTQDLISNSNTKFSLSSLPTALDLFRVAPLANFFKLRGNPCKKIWGGALSFNPTHPPPNTSLATLLPHPDPSPSHPPFLFKLRLSPCPAPTLPNVSLSLSSVSPSSFLLYYDTSTYQLYLRTPNQTTIPHHP